MQPDLYNQSIKIILDNQSTAGGYIACPSFPTYQYYWFRDGSFIAYAMDLINQHESAEKFHNWAFNIIRRNQVKMKICIDKTRKMQQPSAEEYFHCRFNINGDEINDDWPNHQLDSLGTWLWSFYQHISLTGKNQLRKNEMEVLTTTRDYLIALWKFPCSDCWEENGDKIHTYTLASISSGLAKLSILLNDKKSIETSKEITHYLKNNATFENHFTKYVKSKNVDSNLIGLAIPFDIFPKDDPVVKNTIQKIQNDLRGSSGGLHRYLADEYYGGGIWILLTAWLGWYFVEIGDIKSAKAIKKWIEEKATNTGELPEQLNIDLLKPEEYKIWEKRWGEIASPLLWSHAMYIILVKAIENSVNVPCK